jgi:hypothetical protein
MKYDSKKFKEQQILRLKKSKTPLKKSIRIRGEAAITRANLMPKSVKEIVAKTRLDLFGNQDPPFSNIESMGTWIRDTDEKQQPNFIVNLNNGWKIETLPYPIKNGVSNARVSKDDTPLRRLWIAVRSIAKELDCEEYQATTLLLIGTLPVIPALSAQTFPSVSLVPDKISKGKIVITIREPISEDELIKAYRKLRQSLWGDKRDRQPPSERDCKLVEFVKQNIDPDNPQWEKLNLQWNRLYPDWAFHYWRGFRKSYEDAKNKIYPEIHVGPVIITN